MEERGMNARIKALRKLSENNARRVRQRLTKNMKESCLFRSCAPRY